MKKSKQLSQERLKEIDDIIDRTLAYSPIERLHFVDRMSKELYNLMPEKTRKKLGLYRERRSKA